MTGSGGFGGYAPFRFGFVRPKSIRELVPSSESLIDHVLQGLSPRRVIESYLDRNLGVVVTDNTKELYLSTEQPNIDELYHAVEIAARELPAVQFKMVEPDGITVEWKVWVRSVEMGDLKKIVHELREKGLSFTVSEVRREQQRP